MSDSQNGIASPQYSDRDELVQAIARVLTDKFNVVIDSDSEAIEVLETATHPHYLGLIIARKIITIIALICFIYSVFNIFESVLIDRLLILGFCVSISTILSGLGLIILLVFEVFQGAGEDEVKLLKQGKHIFNEYQFIPSLHRFSFVLFLLGLGFLTIIFGFANLYTDLLRQNPDNFSGLQAGFLSIYFSIVTFSTVGYGDIHPTSILARCAVICEIFIAMFFSLIVISTTLSWTIAHRRSQQEITIKKRILERKKRTIIIGD
ncbi:potassium channel family protein [Spirulina sp. 06S082]|uniref:potassium channel family protein n=1 Tax=Spirulina sp. 06S082 TaxID=3110248 RepID=UPI002B1F343D|nr:potassium channel family protein [Spirulina sp. 06S082]MEA5471759.1 potassium channel family protein [Spirulina sp. 06S082]